jgi:hypothetical protein
MRQHKDGSGFRGTNLDGGSLGASGGAIAIMQRRPRQGRLNLYSDDPATWVGV